MIVGPKELATLSGRKQKTAIAAWCKKVGIQFHRNADGWPVTTTESLDRSFAQSVESGPDRTPYAKEKITPKGSRKVRPVLLGRPGKVVPALESGSGLERTAPLPRIHLGSDPYNSSGDLPTLR